MSEVDRILGEIAAKEDQLTALEDQIDSLRLDLELAKRRQAVADQADDRRKEVMRRVQSRLDQGWQVSCVSNRHWWVTREGSMTERATADEMEMIFVLKSKGVVEGVKNG